MSMNTKQAAAAAKSGYSTKELVLDAMFIALTYVFTAFVNVRLPIAANGGLIHLGNVPLFICAILLGKRTGMLAGAFGMGLFDLLSGWTAWAPFTFCDRRCYGLCSWCYDRRTPQHSKRCGSDRCSLCDQSSWLLYCRSDPVSQPVCSGCFYSWKPGADRYSSCDRSDLCRAASQGTSSYLK